MIPLVLGRRTPLCFRLALAVFHPRLAQKHPRFDSGNEGNLALDPRSCLETRWDCRCRYHCCFRFRFRFPQLLPVEFRLLLALSARQLFCPRDVLVFHPHLSAPPTVGMQEVAGGL